jgi:hypothetical protein
VEGEIHALEARVPQLAESLTEAREAAAAHRTLTLSLSLRG